MILGQPIRMDSDSSLAFPVFLFAAQPKEFFLDGLKKLEQRSHKYVELGGGGGICEANTVVPRYTSALE
jgi:hypothetical protein